MRLRLFKLTMVVAFAANAFARSGGVSPESMEAGLVRDLRSAVQLHQDFHPHTRVTNWSQLLDYLSQDNLTDRQRAFREHSPNPGFTNSILEKYVFVPPGVRLIWPPGEVLMISTQPILDAEEQQLRYVIFRNHTNHTGFRSLNEAEVQHVFQNAGMSIPEPGPVPMVGYTPETMENKRALLRMETEMHREERARLRAERLARGETNVAEDLPTTGARQGPLAPAASIPEPSRWPAISLIVATLVLLVVLWRRGLSAHHERR